MNSEVDADSVLAIFTGMSSAIVPPDNGSVNWAGRRWQVFAKPGSLAVNGAEARFTIHSGSWCAHDVEAKRDPMPERAFLVGQFSAGIGLDQPFHISFGLDILAGPLPTALWTDLFQLMPYPDQDPETKAFLEGFPSPQLGLYITLDNGAAYLSWQTRTEPLKITPAGETNPNWQERGRVPLVLGKRIAWDVSCVDSRGGPGGSLMIVMDRGLPTEVTVVDVRDTPIGFNNDKPSYPSLGAYRDAHHAAGDVLDVVFDGFTLTIG